VELLVAEEQTVPVGAALARIATDARPGNAHPLEQNGSAPAPEGATAPAPPPTQAATEERHAPYSPVVQRIAAEHGIELSTVTGTGRGGRVRKQDVLAVVSARGASHTPPTQRPPEPPPAPLPAESPVAAEQTRVGREPPVAAAAPEPPAAGREAAAPHEPPVSDRDEDQLPEQQPQRLSRMRRTIAEHMTRSLQTAAHCTTIIEADFSRVEQERARLRCSPLPIVARSVIDALQRHPALNSTLEGEQLTRHSDINLGIAVSLGEDGLIVPVIHRAQELSAEGLARRIGDLARRARENALSPDEVRGGTFTITNPGGYGSIASTPIINQPQVAILDLEAVVRRPVALTDSGGNDSIAVRPMAYLCLSWDHRALDGALAAQFLATLRRVLEGSE
jgi:pyruvate/2-oxoglutarate dehydrogenase complex dihydrolipoamide acyltransferase (E2) component